MEPLLQALPSGPVSGMTSPCGGATTPQAPLPVPPSRLPTSLEESPNSRHIEGWERDLISLLMFNFLFLIMFKLAPKCQAYY